MILTEKENKVKKTNKQTNKQTKKERKNMPVKMWGPVVKTMTSHTELFSDKFRQSHDSNFVSRRSI